MKALCLYKSAKFQKALNWLNRDASSIFSEHLSLHLAVQDALILRPENDLQDADIDVVRKSNAGHLSKINF